MQYGNVVETGTVDKVLNKPEHPYTKALIASVPSLVLEPHALVLIKLFYLVTRFRKNLVEEKPFWFR